MKPGGVFDLHIEPDVEDEEGASIFVDGVVADRPYRFLLDTGSARTCLQEDAYTSAFPRLASHRSSGVFAASTSADVILLPSISLGPIQKTSFPVVRVPGTRATTGNLIGMDMLKEARLHLRFDEHRVLVDPATNPGFGRMMHELTFDRTGHPYIHVQVGDSTAQAVWDTGASLTIVDLALVRRHPAAFTEAGFSRGTDSTGATEAGPTFIMAGVAMGSTALPPHTVAAVDLSRINDTIEIPMEMIVGYSSMRHANWWFDFPGGRWAITKLLQ